MTFKPTKRNPKTHLDRWVIVADNSKAADEWITKHFKRRGIGGGGLLVWPRFDPTDPFEIYIITQTYQLSTLQFYEVIDIRTKRTLDQDDVLLEHSMTQTLIKCLNPKRPPNVFTHPHPEPEEEYRDELDLRRRWISPDPFIRPLSDDESSLPDVPAWLAPQKRLR